MGDLVSLRSRNNLQTRRWQMILLSAAQTGASLWARLRWRDEHSSSTVHVHRPPSRFSTRSHPGASTQRRRRSGSSLLQIHSGRSWGTTTARASLKRLARAWNFHRSKITRDSSLQLIIMRSADGLTLQLQVPDTVGRCRQPTTRIRRNFSAMFGIIESSTPEWLSTCAWCNLASCVDRIKILLGYTKYSDTIYRPIQSTFSSVRF